MAEAAEKLNEDENREGVNWKRFRTDVKDAGKAVGKSVGRFTMDTGKYTLAMTASLLFVSWLLSGNDPESEDGGGSDV